MTNFRVNYKKKNLIDIKQLQKMRLEILLKVKKLIIVIKSVINNIFTGLYQRFGLVDNIV